VVCFAQVSQPEFIGAVNPSGAVVYSSASFQASAIARLTSGSRVQILRHTKSFYGAQFVLRDGGVLFGWIPKTSITIVGQVPPPPPQQAPVIEANPSPSSFESKATQAFRLFMAPSFDISKYRATQYRFGVAYESLLGSEFGLGIPVSYAFGGGFSSLLVGTNGFYRLTNWGRTDLISRLGVNFEYLSGNGRWVGAVTTDVGIGLRWRMSERYSLGLEPGLLAMLWNNRNIPFNLRGQVMIDVRGEW
jgi:hypothetical protein